MLNTPIHSGPKALRYSMKLFPFGSLSLTLSSDVFSAPLKKAAAKEQRARQRIDHRYVGRFALEYFAVAGCDEKGGKKASRPGRAWLGGGVN